MKLAVNEVLTEAEKEELRLGGVQTFSFEKANWKEIEAVVCSRSEVPRFLVCPNLKWIHIKSAGYDGIVLADLQERSIRLSNARGVYSGPIAEDVLCKMLVLSRNYKSYFGQEEGNNEHVGQIELCGKTIVVLGAGSIGQQIARRAKGFGMMALGYDLMPVETGWFDAVEYGEKSLPALLACADFLVLSLPLTDDTAHLIDEITLSQMKQGAFLINVARGGLVHTDALVQALRDQKLAGAALDVLEEEPLPESSPLHRIPNLLLTPHQAYVGDGNGKRNKELWMKNALLMKRGEKLQNQII